MNIKLSTVLALLITGTFPTLSLYTLQNSSMIPDGTEFRIVVNGAREQNVLIPVYIKDGLTRVEAMQIAEITFVHVMGDKVLNRLDKLIFDEKSMQVHYTWGYNEGDMGHFFEMYLEIVPRLITVIHCR